VCQYRKEGKRSFNAYSNAVKLEKAREKDPAIKADLLQDRVKTSAIKNNMPPTPINTSSGVEISENSASSALFKYKNNDGNAEINITAHIENTFDSRMFFMAISLQSVTYFNNLCDHLYIFLDQI